MLTRKQKIEQKTIELQSQINMWASFEGISPAYNVIVTLKKVKTKKQSTLTPPHRFTAKHASSVKRIPELSKDDWEIILTKTKLTEHKRKLLESLRDKNNAPISAEAIKEMYPSNIYIYAIQRNINSSLRKANLPYRFDAAKQKEGGPGFRMFRV